ncbi:MAG: hypothetical protein U5K00_16540 [Melioribacteraceae bacterium]|nr:hypothetical protein [Melioribacteraceae bacterium]
MGKGIFNYYNSLKEITTTDLVSLELLKKILWKTLYPVIIVDARNYDIQFANEASEILFGSPFQNSHPTNLKSIVKVFIRPKENKTVGRVRFRNG